MTRLAMTRADRAALADALRDMYRSGIRAVDLSRVAGAPGSAVRLATRQPRDVLRVRT